MYDFSILKDIDFTNTENLIFLAIFLVIASIIIWIVWVVVREFIIGIRRLIRVTFNLAVKKPKFDKKNSTAWLHKSEKTASPSEAPKSEFIKANPVINFEGVKMAPEEKKEDTVKSYEEKTEKDIAEELAKMKSAPGGLEAKMPPREEKQPEGVIHEEIKIPTPQKFGQEVKQIQPVGFAPMQNRVGAVENSSNVGLPLQKNQSDSSIFGGKSEVTRSELRQDLKGANAYKAGRQVGLNLNAIERAKMEKEVFSQSYGRNISKTDLKRGIKNLNKKMLGAQSSEEHAKIRKEIKFFKKIGGIKG